MIKLYHASTIPNLKVLEPRVSTHGKSFVYATSIFELAVVFGCSKNLGDFESIVGVNDNTTPFLYETYPGSFKKLYDNEVTYVYEVSPDTFLENQTSFTAERVSMEPVKIINCTKIDNIYEFLNNCIKEKKFVYHPYTDTPEYKKIVENHIRDRIIRFNIIKSKNDAYRFCKEKFPQILESVEKELANA